MGGLQRPILSAGDGCISVALCSITTLQTCPIKGLTAILTTLSIYLNIFSSCVCPKESEAKDDRTVAGPGWSEGRGDGGMGRGKFHW